ncbi:undecaprenyl-diphosphate phosphatase [Sulfurivermis fontis]|uniref:undecaprenyl-diphosphate phosphatase n=1 Tax=Sulfurivermis fontis TaxID=1972068 RepID=UPI000FDA07BA|nr:undecaprenyl-diphosphate phosphatase [Sulfurivermis fontis]
MDLLHALLLGILQGITEFLPISSSAHLILLPALAGWADQGVAFDLAVHVGTLLAVVLYFRRDVLGLTRDAMASVLQRRLVGQGWLAWYLVIGTIPAALAGLLLLDVIDTRLRAVQIIFFTTLGFGLLLGWADWRPNSKRALRGLTWQIAMWVGLAQAISLIPGTSRSGATITAGLLLGLGREAASRFSFLLAIPITALAAGAKLLDTAASDARVDWGAFLAGGISSFVMALIAIHIFLKWLNRFGMWPYVLYRVALAMVIYQVLMN